jgi:hypothetical protein
MFFRVPIADHHRADGGLQQPVEVPDKGGFASTVLPDDGNLFARLDDERNAAQGFKSSGIGKAEVVNLYLHSDLNVLRGACSVLGFYETRYTSQLESLHRLIQRDG